MRGLFCFLPLIYPLRRQDGWIYALPAIAYEDTVACRLKVPRRNPGVTAAYLAKSELLEGSTPDGLDVSRLPFRAGDIYGEITDSIGRLFECRIGLPVR